MLTQTAPLPPPPGPGAVLPNVPRPRLPASLVVGIVLMFAALIVAVVSVFWQRYLIPTTIDSVVTFFQVNYSLEASTAILGSVGIAIVLTSILRTLPRTESWSRWGPVLILAAGVSLSAADLLWVAFSSALFPPRTGELPTWVNDATFSLRTLGTAAFPIGLILSLIGIARRAVARGVA